MWAILPPNSYVSWTRLLQKTRRKRKERVGEPYNMVRVLSRILVAAAPELRPFFATASFGILQIFYEGLTIGVGSEAG